MNGGRLSRAMPTRNHQNQVGGAEYLAPAAIGGRVGWAHEWEMVLTESGRELAERFGAAMERGDIDGLAAMYSDEAMVVSYSRVAVGSDQIRDLHRKSLASHGQYEIVSIDQFREAGDLVMWDATVETAAGLLQTTHVVLVNAEGLIHHHVPGIRGYWGM